MRRRTSFDSFADFRNEMLRLRAGPLTSAVDDIVDDMYQADLEEDSDGLFDDPER